MKNIAKAFLFIGVLAVFSGCVKQMNMVDLRNGVSLRGEYDNIEQTAVVYMPNGEVLSGRLSEIRESQKSYTNNNGFKDNKKNNFSTTTTTSNIGNAFGILRSNSSALMMELKLITAANGAGYGEAKTSDGREFKVQLSDD